MRWNASSKTNAGLNPLLAEAWTSHNFRDIALIAFNRKDDMPSEISP
jgi:hypothetical protein